MSLEEFMVMEGHQVEADIVDIEQSCDIVMDIGRPVSDIQEALREHLSVNCQSASESDKWNQ